MTDEASRRRSFQLMARRMAELVPKKDFEEMLDFERAAGGVQCSKCGLEYVEHPTAPEGTPFTILCDGRRVKL